MTPSDDLRGAMADSLSPDQIEPLLTGTSVPGDLDAGASRVERLLSAMQSPAASVGSGKEQQLQQEQQQHQAVAAIVDAIRESPRPLTAHRRSRMLTPRMSAKAAVAGATLAALLVGGTAAAAATGSLPVPAQSAVSGALAHVGVSVPGPNSHANSHGTKKKAHRAPKAHDETTGDSGATDRESGAKGPDATGPAKHGLCTAWAATPEPNAHSHKRDSVAFTNLQKAADTAGMSVADFCKDALSRTGDDKPSATSSDEKTKTKPSKPEKVRSSTGKAGSDDGTDGTGHAPEAPEAPDARDGSEAPAHSA